jgi:hypothetical protein
MILADFRRITRSGDAESALTGQTGGFSFYSLLACDA